MADRKLGENRKMNPPKAPGKKVNNNPTHYPERYPGDWIPQAKFIGNSRRNHLPLDYDEQN